MATVRYSLDVAGGASASYSSEKVASPELLSTVHYLSEVLL